jgi:hypothetical protein
VDSLSLVQWPPDCTQRRPMHVCTRASRSAPAATLYLAFMRNCYTREVLGSPRVRVADENFTAQLTCSGLGSVALDARAFHIPSLTSPLGANRPSAPTAQTFLRGPSPPLQAPSLTRYHSSPVLPALSNCERAFSQAASTNRVPRYPFHLRFLQLFLITACTYLQSF